MKPGVSLTSAKANLDAIGARLRQEYPTTNGKKVGVNLYPLSREIVGDARVLLLTLLGAVGLLLLVACANMTNLLLVCGVIPAWLYSDVPAAGLTHDGRSLSAGVVQTRMRRAFVGLQVAAALTLVISTLLTTRSFARLQSVNPGFDGGNVLSVQLALPPGKYSRPADINRFADKLRTDLIQIDSVRDAAAISLMPLSGLLSAQDYRVVGQPEPPPDAVPQAHYRIVMPGYFRIMGIRLEGRDFDDYDRDMTRRVAIISRTFAERHWPNLSPVGEHVVIGRDTLEIVAVCDDVKQFSLDAGPTADVYVPLRQMPREQAQFLAARMYWVLPAGRDPMELADAVRA